MLIEEQVSISELSKLLNENTLELYVLQARNLMPPVNVIENVVNFINSNKDGFGSYIIDMYDGKSICFDLFGFKFYYSLEIDTKEVNITRMYPCYPKWSLSHYIDDAADNNVTDADKEIEIARFNIGENNNSLPVLRCIIAHLTEQVRRAANDKPLMHLPNVASH